MTFIANPIYDIVFKYMMEDDKVARILLSALLKKEIVELQIRKHEYTAMQQTRISLFRMDFCATIRDKDGIEHLVLIELQKTWLATETLRFRQYLGTQYLDKSNVQSGEDSNYGLPIISIYILGHALGDLKEPVVYVRRRYLDYDDNVLEQKDKFIESLTHDSIIVQIPYLQGRTRNRLERLLNVFDQSNCIRKDEHFLEVDETLFLDDEQLIVNRLLRAGTTPDVRRAMEVEDEILSEIESRDTTIMKKDQEILLREQVIEEKEQVIGEKDQVIGEKDQVIGEKDQVIGEKDQVIGEKDQVIGEKDQVIGEKDQVIGEKDQVIGEKDQMIGEKDQMIEEKDQMIEEKDQVIKQKEKALQELVCMLIQNGVEIDEIAIRLSLSVAEIKSFYR